MTLATLALCGGARVAVSALSQRASAAPGASAASPAPGNTAAGPLQPTLPKFAFRDQHGKVVTGRDLLGHVWIADFMYTSCQGACPLLTSRLITLQRRLLDPELRFVSFSVDPSTDTPDALRQYATRWNESETRWQLLSTDPGGLSRLTSSLQLAIVHTGGEIVHSDRFFLIDAQGTITDSFDSSDNAALACLLARAGQLLGTRPRTTVTGGSGRELFSSLGCAGCHDDAQLAPPLAGLLGTRVMTERGGSVVVDDDYVRESITDPAAKVVAGYPSSMQSYAPLLTGAELDALVGYVHSLRGAHSTERATSQTDPVCGMPVRVTQSTPAAAHDGRSYHFCSLACARRFQTDPGKYLHAN
ncbi:MAG TPA: SCO family protein [Polyangiaceae bacterium]|nr:SCO family protein [Polyangiaceae bacterium]